MPTTVQIMPKRRFKDPTSTEPNWCYMAPHELVCICHCHQRIPQALPKDPRQLTRVAGVVGGHPKVAIFQPTHAGLQTAKSSAVGPTGVWGGSGVPRDRAEGPRCWLEGSYGSIKFSATRV